jgi:hypothetical protein
MTDLERLERIYKAAGNRLRELTTPRRGGLYGAASATSNSRAVVSGLNRALDKWGRSAIEASYLTGARKAENVLLHMGLSRVYKHPSLDRKAALQDELMAALLKANASIPMAVDKLRSIQEVAALAEDQYHKAATQEFTFEDGASDVVRMARQAVKDSDSRRSLTSKLRKYLEDLAGNDEWIEIGNRIYKMSTYAEMVGRTVLREAQTKATLDVCEQFDNDLVQVSDHQTQCEECAEYEGKIYSISGNHPDYPMLEEEPPYHPNCEHSILPTSDIAIATEKEFNLY